ncbi:MAG: hypothetical protein R3F49_16715 [Planctomycetota bacterium]
MSRGPLFLGGLGHALCRLSPARAAAREFGFDVKEVLYPGFEGRAPTPDMEAFLDSVELQVDIYRLSHKRRLMYATGFGALIALALRARGRFVELPLVFQGAVPWRTARALAGRRDTAAALRAHLRQPDYQRRYTERHFQRTLEESEARAFFSGFSTCDLHETLFEWITPGWLADLEGRLAARPRALTGVTVWLGGRDTLVDPGELDAAEAALGTRWPRVTLEDWGHFPYLDDPLGWIEAIDRAM